MFADLVLLNGKIVTMNPEEKILQATSVKFGKFLEVGTNEDVQSSIGEETEVIELEGRTVLPGFIDSHGHLFSSGIGMGYIDCSAEAGITSIEDIKEKISNRVESSEKGRWIQGIKVDESKLAERRLPNRKDLDEVAPEHPVFLVYVGAHVFMANSKAFEVRGITRDTPDPVPRGRFDREPDTGELTGIIYEGAVDSVRPEPTVEETVRGIEKMCEKYVSAGITCFYDAFVAGREIKAFQEALTSGSVPLRVRWDMHLDTLPQLEDMGFQIPPGFGDEWLKIVGVKVTMDGAISGRTAALRDPYLHKPDYYGELMMTREEIIEVIDRIHSKGLRASVHANGDQAIVNFLDAVQIALEKHPRKDHRHRDIHCSVVDPEIVERIKNLGVLPTIFGAYPYYHGDKILPAFGEERSEWMFPARSMLDAGIKVAAHSDHSASPYPPLMGIHSLVSRRTKKGRPYGLKQRISILEAIRLYTINAAFQMFDEKMLGSIEPGKFADMVVLGRDILTIPSEEIIDVPIEMTIVGGKIVYDSSNQFQVVEKRGITRLNY